jgi:hypothetical protein
METHDTEPTLLNSGFNISESKSTQTTTRETRSFKSDHFNADYVITNNKPGGLSLKKNERDHYTSPLQTFHIPEREQLRELITFLSLIEQSYPDDEEDEEYTVAQDDE